MSEEIQATTADATVAQAGNAANPVNTGPKIPEDVKPDQLTMLKRRADQMDISYGPNIGVDELAKRIKAKLEGKPMPAAEEAPLAPTNTRQDMMNDAMRLVRCRIANLNPNKKDLSGEIVTVSNRFIGAVRRFVPFGELTDDGWHIENVLLQELLDRKFLDIRVVKKRGQPDRVTEQWVKEFAIEILEPLTEEELRTLANQQAAANGMA